MNSMRREREEREEQNCGGLGTRWVVVWRCASLVVLPLLVPGGLALARGEHYYDTL